MVTRNAKPPKPKAKRDTPPWDKPNPKTAAKTSGTKTAKSRAKSVTLTAAEKSEAKARARKAGRPYPNLVDNMQVTKEHKKRREKKQKG